MDHMTALERMGIFPADHEPPAFQNINSPAQRAIVSFNRRELNTLLGLYGQFVAAGEWRDYAIDCLKERAVFSIFRRSGEVALYRIEKNPQLARRQGAYSVTSATGLILKRGPDLGRVIGVLAKKISLITT